MSKISVNGGLRVKSQSKFITTGKARSKLTQFTKLTQFEAPDQAAK